MSSTEPPEPQNQDDRTIGMESAADPADHAAAGDQTLIEAPEGGATPPQPPGPATGGADGDAVVALPDPQDDVSGGDESEVATLADRTAGMVSPQPAEDATIADSGSPAPVADGTVPEGGADASHNATIADAPAADTDGGATIPDRQQSVAPDGATIMDPAVPAEQTQRLETESDGVSVAPAVAVRKLDRFELIRVLGQGAFGTVYLARDPKLDRQVAVKVARTGLLVSRQDIDRFLREARSAAQLRHPNIVPVYEVGQVQGSTYLVHGFIEGRTLKDLLKEKGRLAPREAADLMGRIARALDYAHSQGIIHRDIKPDNILIDRAGEPHIADFGLARRDEHDAVRTREGTLMGTPAYMSPEQAAGRLSEVNRSSDLWSLGIMLDEMLTAR